MQNTNSFGKELRLRKADEFSSVFLFRKAKFGLYFKVHYKRNELPNSRLGIVVSKKVHKRANKRNYMKRSIRELFRNTHRQWLNYDIVVRVLKPYDSTHYSSISQEFSKLTKTLLRET